MWNKFLKITVALLVIVLLAVCAGGYWLISYSRAENSMIPDGEITVLEQADGKYRVCWPAGIAAQRYSLEVWQGDKCLHSVETEQREYVLPALPEETLTLRITSSRDYLWSTRPGNAALEGTILLKAPAVEDLRWQVDWKTGNVTLSYDMPQGGVCTIARKDTGEILRETAEREVVVQADGATELELRVTCTQGNVAFYGYHCATVSLKDEDFLSEELTLQWEEVEQNRFRLSWNETKNNGYLVQISTDGVNWAALGQLQGSGEREFTTGYLAPFEHYYIQVSTHNGAISDTVEVTTAQQTLYTTIWPVQALPVYATPDGQEAIGTAHAGATYCLLAELDGMFAIRCGDGIGYVDSDYCMINAAEYLGGLCSYDIPNSYRAIYRIHGVDIPQVTDTVIYGYDDVQQADGSFLVPVLYPAAQKLLKAALSAREMGYRLKIYDSFRPYAATREIFARTKAILGENAPDGEGTLEDLMTDSGRYGLGNFLAPVTSRHNYGVALDLTLETLDGEQLQMQTVLHDLSWYSALENNGETGNLLQTLMVEAGFATLASEWWHFQDAENFDALKPAYLTEGVDAQCWVMDHIGWRYRLADGTFLTSCTRTIDEIAYEFDADGYVR